jgi:hypothetical protein
MNYHMFQFKILILLINLDQVSKFTIAAWVCLETFRAYEGVSAKQKNIRSVPKMGRVGWKYVDPGAERSEFKTIMYDGLVMRDWCGASGLFKLAIYSRGLH